MTQANTPIPVNTPLLIGNERRYLADCIDSGWISSEGPYVARFEAAVAAGCARRHGIAVANGSAALDVAVAALGLGPGDEVILPSFTIVSCVLAVLHAGATPVVVDCDPLEWTLDIGHAAAAVTPRTRAIMAVHMYGLPVDMTALLALAARHGLAVIEDAAQAHGQTCDGRPCGGLGTISTFSFYPNKLVTTGEGGMVLTDDPALAERCRSLRNLCFDSRRRFVHEAMGWNVRMSNLQAAVGLAQVERLDQTVVRKRAIGHRYRQGLAGLAGVQQPLAATARAENLYWVYGLVLDGGRTHDAEAAMARLGQRGIATRPFFWPMHEQPVFRRMGLFADTACPVAEHLARRGFYLPSGVGLTDAQVDRVVADVHAVLT
ncbi:DegT/DnrJ/EryC1/StrS family aminotransferase [Zavarzinia sp. CC-PAN008]|uniref:DegT/DnrJ/EryC1/StrS family aminotransferase n=1 Tax=Zavarzinia sp. CC-PAN008 TaxID=3243332 RepID=UPI003F7453BF